MKSPRLLFALALTLSITTLWGSDSSQSTSSSESTSVRRILPEYGRLPLNFEANQGQTDAQVRFLTRASGYNLFLTSNQAVLEIIRGNKELKRDTVEVVRRIEEIGVLRMTIAGNDPHVQIRGEDQLAQTSNYFSAQNSHTNIPNFRRVRYVGIYPGIDLLYYGDQRQLEYDFVLNPGSDAQSIRMSFEGGSAHIDANGDLVFTLGSNQVRFRKPVAYQREGDSRKVVNADFVLGEGVVGFRVAPYDRTQPLVIDPSLVYSTFLGGGQNDYITGLVIDSSGNAYVTGATLSPGFPTTAGAFQTKCGTDGFCNLGSSPNPYDAFVTKLDPTGATAVYSTFLGGEADDQGTGIAVDASGNAYVTGYTTSCLFPTTAGAFNTTFTTCGSGGGTASFVTKLNAAGSALVYSTFIGSSSTNQSHAIVVDSAGNAYITGYSSDSAYPTTSNAFQPIAPNPKNPKLVFTELNASGNALLYSSYLAGKITPLFGTGNAIALDKNGIVYITGYTSSPDFPVTANAFQPKCPNCNRGFDAVVVKFNPSLSGTASLPYSSFLGGTGFQRGNGIAVASSGATFVTGFTTSGNFPTSPGAFETTCPGGCSGQVNAFVTALSPKGSALLYSTYLAGASNGTDYTTDGGWAIALDASQNAYITGGTASASYPILNPVQSTLGGSSDAFITELNPTGTAVLMSTYLGGSNNDGGNGIAVAANGNIYVAGLTGSPNFPTTTGAFSTSCGSDGTCNGTYDAFVAQLTPLSTDVSVSISASPNPVATGSQLTYTITAANAGPDTAAAATVSDTLPAGTNFASATVSSGSCKTPPVGSTGKVTCTIPLLAPAASATETLVVNVTATSGTSIKNTVVVNVSSPDPNKANNVASSTVAVN